MLLVGRPCLGDKLKPLTTGSQGSHQVSTKSNLQPCVKLQVSSNMVEDAAVESMLALETAPLSTSRVDGGAPRVKLTLLPSSLSATLQNIVNGTPRDCGTCSSCLDKVKFGGKGTRRQKCDNLRFSTGADQPVSVAASLRVEADADILPRDPRLEAAVKHGPLPLVWGVRRPRRARPLAPAYVLQYHCEGQLLLDSSHLAPSIERYCNRNLGKRRSATHEPVAVRPAKACKATLDAAAMLINLQNRLPFGMSPH